jgi:hypothetical protein
MTDAEKIVYLLKERDELCTKIDNLYQVIGTMAYHLGYFDQGVCQDGAPRAESISFALDYASLPEVFYDDFLPWPKNPLEIEDHLYKFQEAVKVRYSDQPEFITEFSSNDQLLKDLKLTDGE